MNELADIITNPAFVALVAATLGGLVGAFFTAKYSLAQAAEEQKIQNYVSMVDDIDLALFAADVRAAFPSTSSDYARITADINLSLNRAFSKAMVFLDDESFELVSVNLNAQFDKEKRNKIYHEFRRQLFPSTSITYEDVKTKYIKVG